MTVHTVEDKHDTERARAGSRPGIGDGSDHFVPSKVE